MFALLALSSIAAMAALGGMFDMFGSDDTVEQTLTDIDEGDGYDLLDASLPDDLEAGALAQIDAGVQVIDADAVRDDYAPTGSVEIEGTDGDDFIDAGVDVEVTFAGAGDDVVFGADHDQVIFGDAGDDVLFGEGGADQTHGDEGDDTLAGGDGSDLLVGGEGADVIFGGAGDDTVYTAHVYETEVEPNTFDVVNAGEGDDQVFVSQGAALIELGEGADDVLVHSEFGAQDNNPLAIITDFDSSEDQIMLGVHVPDFDLGDDGNALQISYTLTQIETSQGPATLVVPAVEDEALLSALEGGSIGHAVLLGVLPDQIDADDIQVLVTSDASSSIAADSIQRLFAGQSVGAGL